MAATDRATTSPKPNTQRILMWDISSSLADALFAWANVLLIVGAASVLIGTIGAIMMGSVREQFSNERISSNERATAEAMASQKESELKLEQLRKLAGPRSFNFDVFQKALEGKPKAHVQIWYLPDTSDGYLFANRLWMALHESGWQVDMPEPIPDLDPKIVESIMPSVGRLLSTLQSMPRAMNAGGQPSGITVVGSGSLEHAFDEGTPLKALYDALVKSTGVFGVAGSGGSQFMPVPKGMLRVVIAAKTDPLYVPLSPADPK